MIRRTGCLVGLLPSALLLQGCAGNIGAGIPLAAALASCTTEPDARHMVPVRIEALPIGAVPCITAVEVSGPMRSTVPPPIRAQVFGTALESSLRRAGALLPADRCDGRPLVMRASLESQDRQGTFGTTALKLVVRYSIASAAEPDKVDWDDTIATQGRIDDWTTDACERLRYLQERLARENLARMLDALSQGE